MYQIGLWAPSELLYRRLEVPVGNLDGNPVPFQHPGQLPWPKLDLLVIAPEARSWAGADAIRCPLVLLPGTAWRLARPLRTARAVSYGPSPRDTLTLSSQRGDRLCAAVQRELTTVSGQTVEEQELVLPLPWGMDPVEVLAAAGTLLLLDADPERLPLMIAGR